MARTTKIHKRGAKLATISKGATPDKILVDTWNATHDKDEQIDDVETLLKSAEDDVNDGSATVIGQCIQELETAVASRNYENIEAEVKKLKQEAHNLQKKYSLSTELLFISREAHLALERSIARQMRIVNESRAKVAASQAAGRDNPSSIGDIHGGFITNVAASAESRTPAPLQTLPLATTNAAQKRKATHVLSDTLSSNIENEKRPTKKAKTNKRPGCLKLKLKNTAAKPVLTQLSGTDRHVSKNPSPLGVATTIEDDDLPIANATPLQDNASAEDNGQRNPDHHRVRENEHGLDAPTVPEERITSRSPEDKKGPKILVDPAADPQKDANGQQLMPNVQRRSARVPKPAIRFDASQSIVETKKTRTKQLPPSTLTQKSIKTKTTKSPMTNSELTTAQPTKSQEALDQQTTAKVTKARRLKGQVTGTHTGTDVSKSKTRILEPDVYRYDAGAPDLRYLGYVLVDSPSSAKADHVRMVVGQNTTEAVTAAVDVKAVITSAEPGAGPKNEVVAVKVATQAAENSLRPAGATRQVQSADGSKKLWYVVYNKSSIKAMRAVLTTFKFKEVNKRVLLEERKFASAS